MVDSPAKPISESVQMYLVKIKRLQDQIRPVPLSFLAESLCISPVSVNEMCRKMQEQNLIEYQPYKGASLTEEGERTAAQVLRHHRLWEVFLVEKLQFSTAEAHEMADELEHATSAELANRLDILLGNPTVSPEGKEIPPSDEKLVPIATCALASLTVGESGYCLMEGVEDTVREYLNQAGIRKGGAVEVYGKSEDMLLLEIDGKKFVSLKRQLCEALQVVRKTKTNRNPAEQRGNELIPNQDQKEKDAMNEIEAINVEHISLDKMKIGQAGTVISIGGKGPIKQRMMDMGLVPGSDVKVVRVAPLGDPIELSLKGYNLSVRLNEAKAVRVEIHREVE